jgi:1-deoxy-D-xylulose-5-phosphate synthase
MLEKIVLPNDIKKIPTSEYETLASDIRRFLIEKISKNGGHLASNLGVVELTMAMHLTFDLPKDKIIWDVGHQAYTHKILSGRKSNFDELRKHGGLSGFPKRKESEFDSFDTGHSSTSISAGLGIAHARDIMGDNYSVISVIGDGSLTGGMAYEALNNAARLKSNFITVLNDNQMSISENVGGVSSYLNNIRTGDMYNNIKEGVFNTLSDMPIIGDTLIDKIRKTKSSIKQLFIPGMFFENMGITYLGPVDGHNLKQLIKVFNEARKLKHAVIVHVITEKGRGYAPAVERPFDFHGVEPFDIKTGKPLKQKLIASYTDIFAKVICKYAKNNKKIVAITAAMPAGTGLSMFAKRYPDRFFDVGIAEEHAVTFAAGLASAGLKPVVALYSSFLQRAYDQILHDVCIQRLPVVFAIDRAGIVGSDGETHQGIFDFSFLSSIPNMTILAPKNRYELVQAFEYAFEFEAPIAIRYPRGEAYFGLKQYNQKIEYGKSEIIYKGENVAVLAIGSMVKTAEEAVDLLKKDNIYPTLINGRFVKPIDKEMIDNISVTHKVIITLEENVLIGGYGEQITAYVCSSGFDIKVINIALNDEYVEHGNADLLKMELGLNAESIASKIKQLYESMEDEE